MFAERADTLKEANEHVDKAIQELETAHVLASTAEAHGVMWRIVKQIEHVKRLREHLVSAGGRLNRRETKRG